MCSLSLSSFLLALISYIYYIILVISHFFHRENLEVNTFELSVTYENSVTDKSCEYTSSQLYIGVHFLIVKYI